MVGPHQKPVPRLAQIDPAVRVQERHAQYAVAERLHRIKTGRELFCHAQTVPQVLDTPVFTHL